jgi:phage terminase large subunit
MNLELSEKYEPLFKRAYEDNEIDTFILTGGRFSAKSFTTSIAAGIFLKDFDYKILYTRYTMTAAKDSIIPEFLGGLEALNIAHEFNVNIDRITHNSGGEVVFKGMKTSSGNQTAALKSLKGFNCLIVDEAEEMPSQKDFEKIQLSIRHPSKPNISILILNPATKEHWIHKKYFEDKGISGGFNGVKHNVCYIHTSYLDCLEHVPNNILLEFNRMKKVRPKEYNNVVLGGWLDKAEGVVYSDWIDGEFDTSLPYVYGLDFGFSPDPTAMVKVAVDKKNKLVYVQEEIHKLELSTNDIEKIVKDRVGSKNDLVVADCAEKRLINDLRNTGINITKCKKGAGSIKKGIKDLLSYKIIVCSNSINLRKELNNYVWNDKKAGVPVDDFNHLLDALRYGFERANISFYAG